MDETADKKSKSALSYQKRRNAKNRKKNLNLAADSAISRLEKITRPGGDIETMDIKELKNLISAIKELTGVALELEESDRSGGVVILPEVKINE